MENQKNVNANDNADGLAVVIFMANITAILSLGPIVQSLG